jgi:cytochrome oxidase assembly protein ShyY1
MRRERLARKPLEIQGVFPWINVLEEEFKEKFEFTPITLLGKFDKSRYVFVQKTKENEPGYQLVNPFILNNNSQVIVDRGWVPLDWNQIKADLDEKEKLISITGILYKGDKMNDYTKVSDSNIMVNMDTKQISKILKVDSDFIIKELGNDNRLYPKPLRPVDLMTWTIMPETHQSYSNFWLFVTTINVLSNIYVWLI